MNNKNNAFSLEIDRPEKYNRITVFFRLLIIIPIASVYYLVLGVTTEDIIIGAGFLFAPLVLVILFRQKYPKWWFDWIFNLTKFSIRIGAYALLLSDSYPSIDEDQSVHIKMQYPDAKNNLNRYLPLVKWLLAIPHFVVLSLLLFAQIWVTLLA